MHITSIIQILWVINVLSEDFIRYPKCYTNINIVRTQYLSTAIYWDVCATCARMNAVKDVNWCVEKLSNWCIETCSSRIKQALQPYFTTMITNSNDSFKKWFWIKILCNNVPWRMYFMHRYVCNLYFSLLQHHVKLHTNINSRPIRVKIFALCLQYLGILCKVVVQMYNLR